MLRGLDCLLATQLSAQELNCLFISERSQGAGSFAVFLLQALGLLDQSSFEHAAGALVDSLVEGSAVRIEAEPQNAAAAQGIASLLPEVGHFLPRCQADFDGSDQLGGIAGMDFVSSLAVETPQNSVEMI